MIRKKKLVDVIEPFFNQRSLTDELYGQILRRYSQSFACSSKVSEIDYSELCNLRRSLSIIQNGKIFDTDLRNSFHQVHESINACYQINPFNSALVIANSPRSTESYEVFSYKPYAFDKMIQLPYISCFKYLFEYFNVYKSDGSLAGELEDLYGETEVFAVSKQLLHYDYCEKDYPLHIILRWYAGCRYVF